MSSENLNSIVIPLEISRKDELLTICTFFDDDKEKFRQYGHYHKFCDILYQNQENNDEDCFNEGDTVDCVVNAALEIKNYECKIKVLKVLMVYWNKRKILDRENYDKIKEQILSIISSDSSKSDSIFKMSEDYIEYECTKSFFELCFYLKQNQLKKFEFELEILIKNYKKFYGDYYKHAMKKDCGRYLKEVAEKRKYFKTVEFIFYKCPFIEFNSNIMTEFEEVNDLIYIFGDDIKMEDREFLNHWKNSIKEFNSPDDSFEEDEFRAIFCKAFKDDDQTRKRLFGRITEDDTSLLEEMLIYPYSNFIFKCAWDQFRLWTKPEIFTYKNPYGRTLLDYAIESGDEQLYFLLMPKTHMEDSFDKKKHFMVMKNNKLFTKTGKCIVEHLLENLIDTDNSSLFPHFIYLLEEIGEVKDLKKDELVEKLINLARSEDFFEQITGLLPYDNVEMAKKLFHIEDILGNMIVYWSEKSEIYPKYKHDLEYVSSFYKLMFLIIEKKSEIFFEDFQVIMTKLEDSFETRYKDQDESEKYSSNLLFIMLLAAIKTKQRNVIDFIFGNDSFLTIFFEFPDNIVAEEIHYYTALKFLKHKHGIGQSEIPKEWLTAEVLEEFFDSQIKFNNQELIEIDCSSLIHVQSQKKLFNIESNIKDPQIMRDDTDSLEYIISHENLKGLVTHPVIETYINLKSLKYQRIFTWNFWAFVIFFIFPFILLIMYNNMILTKTPLDKDVSMTIGNETIFVLIPGNTAETFWSVAKYLHIIGIIFLLVRESFQCILSATWKIYFKKVSNTFEITLLILSVLLSVFTFIGENSSEVLLKVLEVVLILFTTISATSILPFAHVPNNMQILKKVALTFLRIFYTFAIILIAFSFSFCIMFQGKETVENDNCTRVCKQDLNSDCEQKDDEEEFDPRQNFGNPFTAFIKIITMLSGEYEIQPVSLTTMQLLFFLIFIISSFILFNLILGLSIEDVQELKKSSRAFDLMNKSERFIEVSKKVEDYYNKYYHDHFRHKNEFDDAKFLREVSFKIIRFFLSKYIFLHNISKIMVNMKTKQVFVKDAHKQQSILKVVGRLVRDEKYYISKETFKHIQSKINLKNKKTFKQLMKKVEHEQEDKIS